MKVMLTLYQSQYRNWSVFIIASNLTRLQKHFIKKGHILFKRLRFYLFFSNEFEGARSQWQGKFVWNKRIKINAMLLIISLSFEVCLFFQQYPCRILGSQRCILCLHQCPDYDQSLLVVALYASPIMAYRRSRRLSWMNVPTNNNDLTEHLGHVILSETRH